MLPVLIITAGVVIVFGQSIRHDYVLWDDDALLLSNPAVMAPSIDAVKLAWQGPHEHLYVPLTYNLWFVVARVAGLFTRGSIPAAGWFHAASIAIHTANALLVYALLRQLQVLRSAAVIGALAFALHPLQVEVVAWCSAMKDLLSTGLALVCMLCHVRALNDGSLTRSKTIGLHSAALLAMALATLAKPGVVAVPVMLIAIDLLVLSKPVARALLWNLPLLAVAGAAVIWTRAAQAVEAFQPLPLLLRPAIAVDALAFYLKKLAVPIRLCTDYGLDPCTAWSSGLWMWSWLAPAGIFALVLLIARRHKMLAVGLILFCIGFSPVLGVVPFAFQYYSTVADRYAYLPMIGFAMMAADVAMMQRSRSQWMLAGGVLATWAALSATQVHVWRNGEILERHTIAANPRAYAAYTRLACHVVTIPRAAEWAADSPPRLPAGALEPAKEYCWRSLMIRNDYAPAMNDLVALHLLEGHFREALTLAECFGRLSTIHHLPPGELSYSPLWIGEGWLRLGEQARARAQLDLALQIPALQQQAGQLLAQFSGSQAKPGGPR